MLKSKGKDTSFHEQEKKKFNRKREDMDTSIQEIERVDVKGGKYSRESLY